MNLRFQNALRREPQNVPPIWFMRQAGRYHRHYQALRAKYGFIELCKIPEVAAEVAMGPIQDFDFDVAILFSDLLFPLEAMGMGLSYDPSPKLGWALTEDTLARLRSPGEAIGELTFQKEAMRLTRARLPREKSLIGFVGGPWTLFSYATQNAHEGALEQSKRLLPLFPKFCETLVPLLIGNIELQFSGGAEVVMVFDTAAGELSPGIYLEAVVPELEKLMRAYPGRLGYYAKGVGPAHLRHSALGLDAPWAGLGFDHRWDLADAFAFRSRGFVQGGFDQALLLSAPRDFEHWAVKYLEDLRRLPVETRAGWVSGLGHGILPGTPEENVRRMVQLIREVMA